MNYEQMQALGRVLEHFGHDDVKNYEEAGKPAGHIAEALLALDRYRQARSLEMDDERRGRVPRDDGEDDPTSASALGIYQDHPSHNETLSAERSIVWSLLPLAALPLPIENLIRDALFKDNSELRAPAAAALQAIRQKRHPEDEIPF